LDPIFWLHHANVDRLWNVWLALGGGRINPAEGAWLDQVFTFRDENGGEVKLTGAEVVDSATQLNYVYDDADAPEAVPQMSAPPPPTPASPPELAAASEEPLTLSGAAGSVRLQVPSSAEALAESAADGDRPVFVNVEDIRAERNPGLAYAVYLDLPGDAEQERRHVGNLSLFGIETMNDPDRPHDGAPGFRHTFDATEAVSALKREGLWDASAISVSFEPIVILAPPGEELSPEAQAEAAAPVEPIQIGRVSLFVG
jgi:tyrosinase